MPLNPDGTFTRTETLTSSQTPLQPIRRVTLDVHFDEVADAISSVGQSVYDMLLETAGVQNHVLNPEFRLNSLGYAGAPLPLLDYGHNCWRSGADGTIYTVSDGVCTVLAGAIQQVLIGEYMNAGDYVLSYTGTATAMVNGVIVANGGTVAVSGTAPIILQFDSGTVSRVMFSAGNGVKPYEARPIALESLMCSPIGTFASASDLAGTYVNDFVIAVRVRDQTLLPGLGYVWFDRTPADEGADTIASADGAFWKRSTPDSLGAMGMPTIADLEATAIGAGIVSVTTMGASTPGDGGGATYVRDAAGQVQSADGAWWRYVPGPEGVNVRVFGAVGDGSTDDTAAFQAAWAFYEASALYTASNDYMRGLFSPARWQALFIPSSKGAYIVNSGWKPALESGRIVSIRGDGHELSVIKMPTATPEFFVQFDDRTGDPQAFVNPYNAFFCDGIKLIGGKGLYCNMEGDAPFVQQGVTVTNCIIAGFTEAAAASVWGDDPRWTFIGVRIETTFPGAVGLALPPGTANPSFVDVTIIGCKYRVVIAPTFQTSNIIEGLTALSIPGDGHEADIWAQSIDASEQTDGRGMIIASCRFSNEYRLAKPVLLIADSHPDDAALPFWRRRHSEAASSRRMRDWKIVDCSITGSGGADDPVAAGPVVRSYVTDIGRSEIRHNVMGASFTYMLELMTLPEFAHAGEFRIGDNLFMGVGEPPAPCNRSVGQWDAEAGAEIVSPTSHMPADGGVDPSFLPLSLNGDDSRMRMSDAALVNASASAATDSLGGSNAILAKFLTSGGIVQMGCPPAVLVNLRAQDNVFCEVEMAVAGALPIKEVDIVMFASLSSGESITRRWPVIVGPGWRRHRVSLSLATSDVTALRAQIVASADAYTVSSDSVLIGRMRVYRANRPQAAAFDPVQMLAIEKADLPTPIVGRMLIVTDDVGGLTPAYADGSDWRRVKDGAVIA